MLLGGIKNPVRLTPDRVNKSDGLKSNLKKAELAVVAAAVIARSAPARLAEQAPLAEPVGWLGKVEYFGGQLSGLARLDEVLCQTPHGLSETHSYFDPNSSPARAAFLPRTKRGR